MYSMYLNMTLTLHSFPFKERYHKINKYHNLLISTEGFNKNFVMEDSNSAKPYKRKMMKIEMSFRYRS